MCHFKGLYIAGAALLLSCSSNRSHRFVQSGPISDKPSECGRFLIQDPPDPLVIVEAPTCPEWQLHSIEADRVSFSTASARISIVVRSQDGSDPLAALNESASVVAASLAEKFLFDPPIKASYAGRGRVWPVISAELVEHQKWRAVLIAFDSETDQVIRHHLMAIPVAPENGLWRDRPFRFELESDGPIAKDLRSEFLLFLERAELKHFGSW